MVFQTGVGFMPHGGVHAFGTPSTFRTLDRMFSRMMISVLGYYKKVLSARSPNGHFSRLTGEDTRAPSHLFGARSCFFPCSA